MIFGTLLVAVREKNFIIHDEDIDIYIFNEDKDKILELIYEFKKFGFDVARYEKKSLFSIIRNNEYINFYFFKKKSLEEDVLIITSQTFFLNVVLR